MEKKEYHNRRNRDPRRPATLLAKQQANIVQISN